MAEAYHTQRRQEEINEDGLIRRTGTMWTASAHIITAAIGFSVLSLVWDIAQLGWIGGPIVAILLSMVILYTSFLLINCCRTDDVITGKRIYTYSDAIHSNLGGKKARIYGFFQYLNIFGIAVGCAVASSNSMMAIRRSNCYHEKGRQSPCHISRNPYKIIFGIIQIIFSQIPDFDQIWWLSIIAAFMSFIYSLICLSLSIVQVVGNGRFKGSLMGTTQGQKMWRILRSLKDIAFAYSYPFILVEIQATINAQSLSEPKVMKKATFFSVAVITFFYIVCGCMGYAAFGDSIHGNLLDSFGFYNPLWLLDIANAATVIHLMGAYQLFCHHLFAFIEKWVNGAWPNSTFFLKDIRIPLCSTMSLKLNLFRLVWRSAFVVLTTVISLLLPDSNEVVALPGSLGVWLFTVNLPIEMHIAKKNVPKWSFKWACLQILSLVCRLISLASIVASVGHVFSFYL